MRRSRISPATIESTVWTFMIAFAWMFLGLTLLSGCIAKPERPHIEAPGCELEVNLDPGSVEAGRRAIERINAATGCEVTESPDGVPVVTMPEALNLDGTPACGTTRMKMYADTLQLVEIQRIEISTEVAGCNSQENIIAHEMFHAMIGNNDVHASHGVFHAVSGNGELIDEATLTTVCEQEAVECQTFNPEVARD